MQVRRELLGETLRVSSLTFFIFLYWLFPMTKTDKHRYMKIHLLIYVPNILYGLSVYFKSKKRSKTEEEHILSLECSVCFSVWVNVFDDILLQLFLTSNTHMQSRKYKEYISIFWVLSMFSLPKYFSFIQCKVLL